MERCKDWHDCPGSEPFYVGHFSQVVTEKHGYAPAYCSYCPDFVPETNAPQTEQELTKLSDVMKSLRESFIRSIENRRDLQEHFKLHHALYRKRATRTKKYD